MFGFEAVPQLAGDPVERETPKVEFDFGKNE
jgi:hypothetical protein